MFHLLVATPQKAGIKARRPTFRCRRHTRRVAIGMQEKLIGESYYSLADLGCMNSTLVESEERNESFLYSLGVTP